MYLSTNFVVAFQLTYDQTDDPQQPAGRSHRPSPKCLPEHTVRAWMTAKPTLETHSACRRLPETLTPGLDLDRAQRWGPGSG